MNTFDFVESVKSQWIFKQWFKKEHQTQKPPSESPGPLGNRLVVNKNLDLIYAVENTIRFCFINSTNKNYRLLKSTTTPFDIQEIGLNSLGTFLYSTDFKTVVVQDVPTNGDSTPYLHNSKETYELKGLDANSHIKKIIWNDRVARDLSLVVLEDSNFIKLYDLARSESPRITINLNQQPSFQGQKATSISYGSCNNLIGGLTLYITTESSKVFAIYPFVAKKSKICVTKEEVEISLAESYDIETFTHKNFPYPRDDDMSESIAGQIAFFKSLKSQLKSPAEVRINYNNEEIFYYTVRLKSSSLNDLWVQGPIADLKMGVISDICNIGFNDDISILLVINNDKTNLTVKFLGQLKPLVMRYGIKEDSILIRLQELSMSLESKKIDQYSEDDDSNNKSVIKLIDDTKPYAKPKLGFGYVDSDSEEDISEPNTAGSEDNTPPPSQLLIKPKDDPVPKLNQMSYYVPSEDADEEFLQQKSRYWLQNFVNIDQVGIDILDYQLSEPRRIIKSNIDPNRFLIYTNDKIIICTPNDWIEQATESLFQLNKHQDNNQKSLEIWNHYSCIDYDTKINIAFVEDNLTYTGDYVISASFKLDNFVKMVKIKESEPPSIKKLSLEDDEPYVKIETKINNNMLSDIETDLQKIRPISSNKYVVKIGENKTKALETLNEFSNEVLEQIQNFFNILIKLDLKIASNVMEMKFQVDLMKNLSNVSFNDEITRRKITSLKTKQLTLHKRSKLIHNKLIKKMEDIRINKQVPLSAEEKKWFKEINQITSVVGQDNTIGLTKTVSELDNQVEHIKSNMKFEGSESQQMQKIHQLQKNWKSISDLRGVKDTLNNQWISLSALKSDVGELLENIKDKQLD